MWHRKTVIPVRSTNRSVTINPFINHMLQSLNGWHYFEYFSKNYNHMFLQVLLHIGGIWCCLCKVRRNHSAGSVWDGDQRKIAKNQGLSDYLSIPVNALVTNDCAHHPAFVLWQAPYAEIISGVTLELGRSGEDAAFQFKKEHLEKTYPNLAKLILPFYNLRHRPGYDILSFDDSGRHPLCNGCGSTNNPENSWACPTVYHTIVYTHNQWRTHRSTSANEHASDEGLRWKLKKW